MQPLLDNPAFKYFENYSLELIQLKMIKFDHEPS